MFLRCPRCGGSIMNSHGDLSCLMCGYVPISKNLPAPLPDIEPESEKKYRKAPMPRTYLGMGIRRVLTNK